MNQQKNQTIQTLGIDLAKSVFQLHGVNGHGKTLLKRKMSRLALSRFMANLPPCLVGMESCAGAHYWANLFQKMGHTVKLMPPQYVKPYVKSHKNDARDAEAICEAVTRPNMRFVPIKTAEQQDIQHIHRVRDRLVKNKTALMNEIRGILLEKGIVFPQGAASLHRGMAELLQEASHHLSRESEQTLVELMQELRQLEDQVKLYEKRIQAIAQSSEVCNRLQEIRGVGPLSATALVAALGDPRAFKKGRSVSAWLGLVPRQYSSGGKTKLLGISKRGNKYLRYLLIQGAHAALRTATLHSDAQSLRMVQLQERLGTKRAAVAIANKNSRLAWALMVSGKSYRVAA